MRQVNDWGLEHHKVLL